MKPIPFLALSALLLFSAGCAQHQAYVVAHRNPQCNVTRESKLTVSAPTGAQTRSAQVHQVALAELKAGGFQLVGPAEADYTLLILVDKNAHTVVRCPSPMFRESPALMVPTYRGNGYQVYSSPYSGPMPTPSKGYTESEGIRLTLYPARAASAAEIRPAWDGFIDSGRLRLSPARHAALLKTLLGYFSPGR